MIAIFPFAFYSIFRVELRYLVPYLPVYLIWGGIGCGILVDWLRDLARGRRWAAPLAAALVYVSLVPFAFHKYVLTERSQEVEWRAVGAWLRAHAGPNARVLTHSGCPASYYAGNPEAMYLPWTDPQGLVRFARAGGFEYVLIDERYVEEYRPMLKDLIVSPPSGLEEIRDFDVGGSRVVMCRISVPPNGAKSE